ncbi:MAG: PQQ-dependent sugar dehydrogenase [Pyrinomonadaceae bacterium]|jgi:glucose/arabinose dehydrogenase|nr:PQQ-dependent sugar dehydrogenase [Pyrinomonadaceae bacterium]
MKVSLYSVVAVLISLALACGQPPPGQGAGEIKNSSSKEVSFKVETMVAGLQVPWSMAWAPDGRMFFTERPGRVRLVVKGQLLSQPLIVLTDVEPSGESGLMSLALHPQFANNHFLYLSYAYKGEGQLVRVVRYRETETGLTDRKVIIENIPAAQFHAGCRLGFGPDAKLYITTGDATERALAQRLDSLAGKTLRLNDDGTVPSDNPFVGQQNARREIWSLGHRNAQGMDWQPGTDLMFQTEHGPSGFDGPGGGDEVNIIERGKNYGWPLIHHKETRAGLEAPLLEYTPAVAPASGAFYSGSAFPQFRENFFFGCLRGERIIRVVLDGPRVISQEALLQGKYGRIRDIAEGPDGAIYFSTSNQDGRGKPAPDDDRIIRLVPVK